MISARKPCILRKLRGGGDKHLALAKNPKVFVIFSFLLLCAFSTSSFADDNAAHSKNKPDTAPVSNTVVQNEDGSVSIMAGNAEIVRVDQTGITINGDIKYTGTLTDTGALSKESQEKGGADE